MIKKKITKDNIRRISLFILVASICTFMLFVINGSGSVNYNGVDKAHNYVLKNHVSDTGAKNAVTAIYLNYRLWDTIFESMLLLVSTLAVISFSWRGDNNE